MSSNISKILGFSDHKMVSYVYDEKSGLSGFISIHRANKNIPAFGATRYWNYKKEEDALQDALRLAKTMSYKSALAGLKYGGAKAALIKSRKTLANHDSLLKAYADRVNLLKGSFVTGTDVGITDEDVKSMRRRSRYFVGVSADPARYTALGVLYSIEACLQEVFGTDKLHGRSFAIRGLGKTGGRLLEHLYSNNSTVYVTDIDKKKTDEAKKKYPEIKIVSPDEIDKLEVDVYSPCALSNAVNNRNILNMKCKIVCGSANNQLEDDGLGQRLYKMGILYAPDYAVNAGGLISVVDEYEESNSRVGRTSERVKGIKSTIIKIIDASKKTHTATNIVADQMAEERFSEI